MIRTTRKEDAEDQLIVSLIKDKTELQNSLEQLRSELSGDVKVLLVEIDSLRGQIRDFYKSEIEHKKEISELRVLLDGYKRTEEKSKKYLTSISELQQDKETYLKEIKNYDGIVKEFQKGLPKKTKELRLENVDLKKQIEEKNKIIQGYLNTVQVDKDVERRDNLITTLGWARRDYEEAIKKGMLDVSESNKQRLLKFVPILIELERKVPFNKRKFYFTADKLESEINLRYLKGITATEHPTPNSLPIEQTAF